MWWIDPREAGYVLARVKRLDGDTQVRFVNQVRPPESQTLTVGDDVLSDEALFLTARDVANISGLGWRNYPGATAFRSPGCYAFQVDGKAFSYTVVFEVVP